MSEVQFSYNSNSINIQCNKNEKMKDIFNRFKSKTGLNQKQFIYIYSGNVITNEELTFDQISNSFDQTRNKMTILVDEQMYSYPNSNQFPNTSEFIYKDCNVKNEEMKEFAEMTIIYAIKKYPDDDAKKSKFVRDKFVEKYGNSWSVCFIKDGNCWISYYDYFIEVLYNGYQVSIGRTSV